MPLPNFLCIGAPKAGTSWLDVLLRSHPDIYVPSRRKELRFFNKNYERGLEWYTKFFPADDAVVENANAIGEVTPAYIHDSKVPGRVKEVLGNEVLFIVMLRNPVDRLYSHYKMTYAEARTRLSFPEFVEDKPGIVSIGNYFLHIKNYLEIFPKTNFLFLVYEDLFANPEMNMRRIGNHLGVDPDKFDVSLNKKRVNAYGSVPKYQTLFRLCRNIHWYLRKKDMDYLANFAMKMGIKRDLFGSRADFPTLNTEMRDYILEQYRQDIYATEKLIDTDLASWWLSKSGEEQ